MFQDDSSSLTPTHTTEFNSTSPSPPSRPSPDDLDDIYGFAVSPRILPAGCSQEPSHEILSDLPSRRRVLDNDAYREGLSASKGQFVQEGFDEGYALGANLGQRVGYILGVLQGLVVALRGVEGAEAEEEAGALLQSAEEELAIQELLGKKWVDEEGIWKWRVKGREDDFTFREVAEQHPVVSRWIRKVTDVARAWDVDLTLLENSGKEDGNNVIA